MTIGEKIRIRRKELGLTTTELGHSRIQTTLRYAKTLQQDVHISHSHFVA